MHKLIGRRLTYANIAATLALVLSMTGGAYAASKYLVNSTKQISPKVLAKLKGRAGAKGLPGATGAQGKEAKEGVIGATGAEGAKATIGATGATGATGAAGTGVTGATGATGAEGKEGPFPKGNAPSGVTIRGNYAAGGPASGAGQSFWDQISFGYQLASAPTTHFVAQGASPPAECPGSATSPQATAGNLCVYEGFHAGPAAAGVFNPATGTSSEANRWGAGIVMPTTGSGTVLSYGTWAVTTP